MMRIGVKILGHKTPQRYAVRRAVLAAWNELLRDHPGLELDIVELKELLEIQRYTQVFVYPSLVVNEQLVCVGRFPKKEEILIWLQQALMGEGEAARRELAHGCKRWRYNEKKSCLSKLRRGNAPGLKKLRQWSSIPVWLRMTGWFACVGRFPSKEDILGTYPKIMLQAASLPPSPSGMLRDRWRREQCLDRYLFGFNKRFKRKRKNRNLMVNPSRGE